MRLDKFLSETNIGTRSEVKSYIKKGFITVNAEIIKKPDIKIDENKDCIAYLGQPVLYQAFAYFMLNKPAGYVSARIDNVSKTVLELLGENQRDDLFPVGRLDKDTEGLLLITNDGMLSHNLLSPKKHVDKVYYAKIDGQVSERDIALFAEGLDIKEEKKTLPAKLEILHSGEESEIYLTIKEGRFHQVKRMFEAVDKKVTYLKRISMGSLQLDSTLKSGEYRALTALEIEQLKKG